MTKKQTLPDVVSEVYTLLEPLQSDDRQKVVSSVMTLLGEKEVPQALGGRSAGEGEENLAVFGPKARRWLTQNSVSAAAVEEIFHREGDSVEVSAAEVPGSGKRGKTQNCYLLAGIRSLLATDEAKFADADAVALCKAMGCHDSANHAKTRSELGNNVAGTKASGFTLPAPGLRAAAALVKQMSSES